MHVVINTLSVTAKSGGVKTFLLNTLRAALARAPERRFVALCSRANEALFRPLAEAHPHFSLDVLPLRSGGVPARIWADQLVVPARAARYEGAVLVSQASVGTLATRLPQVVIVQAPFSVRAIRREVPESADLTTAIHRFYYDTALPLTLRRADEVLAVSEYLRERLLQGRPGLRGKVHVLHEGVDAARFARPDPAGNASGSAPYVLFASTLFAYKRADQAIRAFARVRGSGLAPDTLRLKVAGKDPDGRQRARLAAVVHEEGVADHVDFLGQQPLEAMPALFQQALAFVYPSVVETFGLPILEAMAAGTPVVASNRMSVPEVAGDAALVVDPDDTAAFAQTLGRVLTDRDLRDGLVRRGRARAVRFSWDATADGVLAAVDRAAAPRQAHLE